MEYTEDFIEAAYVAKTENLFLGYGNPNGKILLIDMEQNYNSAEVLDSEKYYEDLLRNRTEINQKNANDWFKNIGENFITDWDLKKESKKLSSNNPLNYFSNQKNLRRNGLEESNTEMNLLDAGLQYQKIYENVFIDGKKQEYMNFEKEIFITYMNDLPFNKTCDYSTLNRLKQESIDLRKDFFKLFFFKSFPVIILATDSYPHKYNFSIEDSFGRYWSNAWQPSNYINSWWHRYTNFNNDDEKTVFHTSQINPPVTDNLIESISEQIKLFFEYGYYE